MRSRRNSTNAGLTRREWTVLLGIAAPLAAQPPATPPASMPAPTLDKALADVRKVSDRLAQIEVPMNIEPAFVFKA